MSLSKQYLCGQKRVLHFDPHALSVALQDACPDVILAFLLGSSKDGCVGIGSDIDLALYTENKPQFNLCGKAQEVLSKIAPDAHYDIGFLKTAEPVYRFEALKGRLLFARNRQVYLDFFSRTCREFEFQIADYKRQHGYRMTAHG